MINNHEIFFCSGTKTSTSRKEQQEREREHAKRRKQKKLERFKNLEKEGEKGKNKWQNFSNKASMWLTIIGEGTAKKLLCNIKII